MYLTIALCSSPDPRQERCLTEQDMDDDEDDGPHVSRLLDIVDCLTVRIDQLEKVLELAGRTDGHTNLIVPGLFITI